VAALRQRNTEAEKACIKAGEKGAAIRPDKPAKARQTDTDARWTVKSSKAKPAADDEPQIDIAIPTFGYKSHISIDRRHGLIRRGKTTASDVWADTAYRSAENERYLAGIGRVSRIHRRKPRGRSMPRHHARANAANSAVRAHVEHPFAHQKGIMGLVIRTIGLARESAAVTLTNMAYNMKRWCWLGRRAVPA